jgi:peptidoglycan/LPS O-acetylase OafA/YrhL
LYFVFLFFGVALGAVFQPFRVEAARVWAFIFLSGNWYVAAVSCSSNPIAPLWSISLEEQFYLVWPWLAKFAKREVMLAISVLLMPVSWLALIRLAHSGAPIDRTIWVNSFVQFQFFGLGALLAFTLRRRSLPLGAASRLSLLFAGVAVWLTAQGLYRIKGDYPILHPQFLVFGYTLVAVGCVLLFLGFLGMPSRWLPGWMTYLGKISYGLYVFHVVAFDLAWKLLAHGNPITFASTGSTPGSAVRYLVMLFLALALTILMAICSYRFLEGPFLKIKERFALVRSRAI